MRFRKVALVRSRNGSASLSHRCHSRDGLCKTAQASDHVSFQFALIDAKGCGGFAFRESCTLRDRTHVVALPELSRNFLPKTGRRLVAASRFGPAKCRLRSPGRTRWREEISASRVTPPPQLPSRNEPRLQRGRFLCGVFWPQERRKGQTAAVIASRRSLSVSQDGTGNPCASRQRPCPLVPQGKASGESAWLPNVDTVLATAY